MAKASMIVITSVPFGYGNLSNLESALEAVKLGVQTYVIDEEPIDVRDFTGGKATALMDELKKAWRCFHQTRLRTARLWSTQTMT